MFKVGDKVEWESQGAGSMTRKVGFVWGVVPPQDWIYVEGYPNHRVMFDGGLRNQESYLIEVAPSGKATKRPAKPKLYWPRASQLRKVED